MATPAVQEMIRYAAARGEGTWKKTQGPAPNLTSRELFTYALALAEARTHPERLGSLFETAARMHDRDPESRGYGNFRWSWSHNQVMDFNAVEFCMMGGSLLWLRHRDWIPDDARRTLREILEFATEGCLRHRVRPAYTNIALMNAENLILLGEALGNSDVADEGYRRLDRFVMHTWEHGISEYGSPCYYGVDLDCLGLIERFCRRERGREQARALLELFWTDVALNFFPPSLRLAGPHSRDYNYLRGNGSVLDNHLWAVGWLPGKERGGLGLLWPALIRWRPPAHLLETSRSRFPRLVRQSWRERPCQSRTHYVMPDVTLGAAAANYHNMDLPLTVDLPGDSSFPRCYVIPDARGDPYGKKRIREGRGAHSKTLHLRPFWTAAQRKTDALGLVLYRDEDQTRTATTLESHFVVPRDVHGFWIGEERVAIERGKQAEFPIPDGNPLVLRKGTAAVGVRVVWARTVGGEPAGTALVDDANPDGVVRLTVTHHRGDAAPASVVGAGAALWVRVGSDLETDDAFDAWRRAFAKAAAEVRCSSSAIDLRAETTDGPLAIETAYPEPGEPKLLPEPARGVLELDGRDVGRPILERVEPVKSYLAYLAAAPPVSLEPGRDVTLEAESGHVVAPMTVAGDAAASGGKYVWCPGKIGDQRGGGGKILWNVSVATAGTYCVWGRVVAPTPDDDSFYVAVTDEQRGLLGQVEWHTGVHRQWTWVRLTDRSSRKPIAIPLPQGKVRLELRAREDGAKLDRLFLTPDADAKPQ